MARIQSSYKSEHVSYTDVQEHRSLHICAVLLLKAIASIVGYNNVMRSKARDAIVQRHIQPFVNTLAMGQP
jgi:hypothetical protein